MNYNDPSCKVCPKGAKCLGGAELELNPGYWRYNILNDTILECINKPENCRGGINSICSEGYVGPLCEECDVYGEFWNYFFTKTGK